MSFNIKNTYISNGSQIYPKLTITQPANDDAITINKTGTGAGNGFTVQTDGTGKALQLTQTRATGGQALYINDAGNANCVYAETNNLDNIPLKINKTASKTLMDVSLTANDLNYAYGLVMAINNAGANNYAFRFNGAEAEASAVPGTQDKRIRIMIGATDYYIPCYR